MTEVERLKSDLETLCVYLRDRPRHEVMDDRNFKNEATFAM